MTPEQVEMTVNEAFDAELLRPLADDLIQFDESSGRWYGNVATALGIGLGLKPDAIFEEVTKGEFSAALYGIADLANISFEQLDYVLDGYDLRPCRLDHPEHAPYYLAGFRIRARALRDKPEARRGKTS